MAGSRAAGPTSWSVSTFFSLMSHRPLHIELSMFSDRMLYTMLAMLGGGDDYSIMSLSVTCPSHPLCSLPPSVQQEEATKGFGQLDLKQKFRVLDGNQAIMRSATWLICGNDRWQ